ncbi:AEC family transporter [Pontibacter cellulosilyticus]|uniref:AEC family transporter n=1 Tax=Pontibacter cellulosilyticus TaxID=1720253 RepID=A0A923N2J9_9BACT|nr:AEC family transporter [Pontibacter cellulosilyticus]MBC5991228.1 AEC family transporter [Pontibacter cellulosilyticus]
MSSFILLFGCLLLGVLLQRVRNFPPNTPLVLNQFIIYISLPALALYFIPEVALDSTVLLPVGVAWICFAGSALFFWSLGKAFGWSRKLIGCLILTAGLGNTSFIGFPVIEALYGQEGLKTAILIDQPGSFFILSTVGIAVAAAFSRGTTDAKAIAKKIFTFPPFFSFVLAIILNLLNLHFSDDVKEVFQRLGSAVTPLALVSVGLQLRIERKSKHWRFLILGLTYQLMLAPLLIYTLYYGIMDLRGEMIQITIVEAAMAPMITACIVAATYGLKPKLANMMIGFGIPISFITLAFWYWLVQGI